MKSEDTEIQKLFDRMRRDDESQAPSFGELLRPSVATRQLRPGLTPWRWAAAAAVVALVVSATWVFWHRSPDARPVPGPAMDGSSWAMVDTTPELPWQRQVLISQWRSPTDSLLDDFR